MIQWTVLILDVIIFKTSGGGYLDLSKDYAIKFSETTGIEIQTQHWCGNRQLSMEGISVEYFPTQIT